MITATFPFTKYSGTPFYNKAKQISYLGTDQKPFHDQQTHKRTSYF